MMVYLLRSWRDSLSLLLPKNLKLFALVTLKSIMDTYKVLLSVWYLWLVPVVLAVITDPRIDRVFQMWYPHPAGVTFFNYIFSMDLILSTVFIFLVCLAARASVESKSLSYFMSYNRFLIKFVLLFVALPSALLLIVLFPFVFVYPHNVVMQAIMNGTEYMYLLFKGGAWYTLFFYGSLSPLLIFVILFFADSDGTLKQLRQSFVRAFKMALYNYPLCLMVLLGLYAGALIVSYPFSALHQQVYFFLLRPLSTIPTTSYTFLNYVIIKLLSLLLAPIPICIWTNIYTKRVHEQPKLYFKQPK